MDAVSLIVGLGNPGGEYERSPHNAGFEVVDRARALCKGPRFSLRGESLVSDCRWRGQGVFLLKPLTYMNRSGSQVELWIRKSHLNLDQIIVCYDDLDLPFGRVRLRASGGTGGHHGMESLLESLESLKFPRIRIGIGDEGIAKSVKVDYLLTPLEDARWELLCEAAQIGAEAALAAASSSFQNAMNRFNRRADPPGVSPERESEKRL